MPEQKSKFGRPHRHMTPDGEMTSGSIEQQDGMHTHTILNADGFPMTLGSATEGIGHTHRIPGSNQETLGPN